MSVSRTVSEIFSVNGLNLIRSSRNGQTVWWNVANSLIMKIRDVNISGLDKHISIKFGGRMHHGDMEMMA